jgi:hypothetical protein
MAPAPATRRLQMMLGWAGHLGTLARYAMTITTDDGFRGIWYYNQPQPDQYRYKYSGGFATYPQQIIPIAVYAPQAGKTFFCYGGRRNERNTICNMVAYYDHAAGTLSRPVRLLARPTHDAHYNATLALDAAGHLYVFCNSHGQGYELDASDPTYGKSYIFRSDAPYALDAFTCVHTDNFSYSQVWPVAGRGLLWLHTRYDGAIRRLFWATSADGRTWSQPHQLTSIQRGSYQISWAWGQRVATVFDYHPEQGGLNARTNLYYLETHDFGASWQTVDGRTVQTPIDDVGSPALVHDYASQGLLVYLKDVQLDAHGRPVILYVTSKGPWSGPGSAPRTWQITRWSGRAWETHALFAADHNYDHGSLYVEGDLWRLIAPSDPGPQPGGTGGEIAMHVSHDQGASWQRERALHVGSGRNQTYVRRPLGAQPDFYALWADGDPFEPSVSHLYYATRDGRIFRMPPQIDGEIAFPEPIGS